MNVAECVIENLVATGIGRLYCLPGVQNDDFFDALFHRSDVLCPVHTRHEQGAAYMATGAALATGRPQAYCVVPGPGFLNTTAALCTALAVNVPVCALIGQIPSESIGRGHGQLHDLPDQFGMIERLTKTAYRLSSGQGARSCIRQAMNDLMQLKHQPVGIEIPVDVWRQEATYSTTVPEGDAAPEASIAGDLDRAIELMRNARCPMIVVGGGALNDSRLVSELTEHMSACVLANRNGRGVLPSDNPLSVNLPEAHDLWPGVDLLIGLGSRMSVPLLEWGMDDRLDIIHINVDEQEIGRVCQPTAGLCGRIEDIVPLLLHNMRPEFPDRKDWLAKIHDCKTRFAARYLDQLAPQLAWLNAIRSELPSEGIFVEDITQIGFAARLLFPVCQPRTYLCSGYQGTLGAGLAMAMGAADACEDTPVISISGDGGALFNMGELATAVHHGISMTAIVFNDNAYGNVRRIQQEMYGGRIVATDLTSPDFARLAESYGAQGLHATTPDELRARIRDSFRHDGPSVIEVPVGEFPSPWDFILMPPARGVAT